MSESSIILSAENIDISRADHREALQRSLIELDQNILNEPELRRYLGGLKLLMGAFIQRVGVLEFSIYELKREQESIKTRMESMYLQAQLEIQKLRSEVDKSRYSKRKMDQIVKVAQTLQGNAYAPYALRSMMELDPRELKTSANTSQEVKLPSDFTARLKFAQDNGFRWNQNNRKPSKAMKQLQILEAWENQFVKVEKLAIEQILDKSYICSIGSGAIAGALMFLERELGQGSLPERTTHSVYNCYQKAIKLYEENKDSLGNGLKKIARVILTKAFTCMSFEQSSKVVELYSFAKENFEQQMLKIVKNSASKSLIPTLEWNEENSETEKLYAIQSGVYDQQILNIIREHYSDHES